MLCEVGGFYCLNLYVNYGASFDEVLQNDMEHHFGGGSGMEKPD